MAQTKPTRKKTSSSTRKNTSKKTTTKSRGKQRAKSNVSPEIKYEIIVLIFVALSIFLIISVYFGLGGILGKWVQSLFFGMLGIGAYLMPIYCFGVSFLKIFNRDNERLNNKFILFFMLILTISTFGHTLYVQSPQINKQLFNENAFFPSLTIYFQISAKERVAGGFIGGFFGDIFEIMLGGIGSYIILTLIIISLIILITEKSLLNILKYIWTSISTAAVKLYRDTKEVIINQQKALRSSKSSPSKRGKSNSEEVDFIKRIELQEELKKEKEGEKAREYFLNKSLIDEEETATEQEDFEALKDMTIEEAMDLSDANQMSLFEKDKSESQENSSEDVAAPDIKKEIKSASLNRLLYEYPPLDLLKDNPFERSNSNRTGINKNALKLQQTFKSFGVGAKVVNVSYGPTITRYELQPDQGVKVSKIVNLSDDIALNLAASGIRIEAPIPGKSLIGIEVPNKEVGSVFIKEVIATNAFRQFPSKLAFALGKDVSGETIVADIAKMPHMLISGATGSGKSVCVNSIITSILFRASPEEVKLLMIDPKVVELKVYNGIPHLLIPVVVDPKKAASALYWAVQEMSERYQLFAAANVRDLTGYNAQVAESGEMKKLPQIVIIVDELADLMQVAAKDVEEAICRLAQMARAAGIHLILATQRPSVDVITGIIKANIPSRIAFAVSSGTDSRTIIDMNGAEKLVGKGDMLYYPSNLPKPIRVQGAFISDKEVENIVEFLKKTQKANYDDAILDKISKEPEDEKDKKDTKESKKKDLNALDENFEEVLEFVIDNQVASASMIQRRFRMGFNRAARLIDQLYDAGFIGDREGSKPRKVLMSKEEYYRLKQESSEISADEIVATDENTMNEENKV